MNIEQRQTIERRIIRKAVEDILAAGCTIRVHDGDGFTSQERLSTVEDVMDQIMATDEEELYVYYPAAHNGKFTMGTISLVYGNDGYDVIADNSVALEPLLAGATTLADQIAEASA